MYLYVYQNPPLIIEIAFRYFKNILEENISSDKILLHADGSWKPFQPQDSNENILTLDDTLECSSHAANVSISAANISEAHHTTIDLFSEEEDISELDDEDGNSSLRDIDSGKNWTNFILLFKKILNFSL